MLSFLLEIMAREELLAKKEELFSTKKALQQLGEGHSFNFISDLFPNVLLMQ